MALPRIALTMGDPAGVGPETTVRALASQDIHKLCRPILIGRPELALRAIDMLHSLGELPHRVQVHEITSPGEATSSKNTISCLSAGADEALNVKPRTIDPRGGRAACAALEAAVRLALDEDLDAIVTGPLHKLALRQAGYSAPGHTELLAQLCGVNETAMMLYLPTECGAGGVAGLGVVHVTLHTSLRDAVAQISAEVIVHRSQLADEVMRRLGVEVAPHIGVCALNPHAGEDGLFGNEEKTIITPAVAQSRDAGLKIEGPLPADALFPLARDGRFDALVAMYHDQGHIPLKLLGGRRAVNITLGLPIIRTSVAHGTAFDIAWRGEADCQGLFSAVATAARLQIGL